MEQIINLRTRIVTDLAALDEDGNALPVPPLEIPIIQPNTVTIAAAGAEWERRMAEMRAVSPQRIAKLFAEAAAKAASDEE